jgi:pre-mRNA-processing factor 40
VYYFNSKSNVSQWEKPVELQTAAERSVSDTDWKEYKIWDGRTYFHNEHTKCSVWAVPPEVIIAQKTVTNASETIDQDLLDCASFDNRYKSHTAKQVDFFNLLREKGISEESNFDEAMEMIKDDIRFHALPTIESKRVFFASYVSHLLKSKILAERDLKQNLLKQAIHDFQHWSGMNESTTCKQMEAHFKRRDWFKKLDHMDLRKFFELYSLEFMEVSKIKKQQLQDTYMQNLKDNLLMNQDIDFSAENVVDDIYQKYKYSDEPFWTSLGDSKKLIVIKSCISQRIREAKLALANGTSISKRRL